MLLYPYCGLLSLVSHRGWRYEAPVKFILAKDDTITDEKDCIALIGNMREEVSTSHILSSKTYARV